MTMVTCRCISLDLDVLGPMFRCSTGNTSPLDDQLFDCAAAQAVPGDCYPGQMLP
jgi:hypothetical protein